MDFIVIDVNVVLSSLLNRGDSLNVFSLNSLFQKFNFVAPEFLLTEFDKHKEEILKRTKLSKDEFEDTINFIFEQISFIPIGEFNDNLPMANEILKEHYKDVQYVALALKLNCPIFSGDKVLRNLWSGRVLSPKEMINKFYNN